MDDISTSTEPDLKYLASRDTKIRMCPAKLAVRVSNVPDSLPRPKIDVVLRPATTRHSPNFPLISFACTHWEGASPTISPFPFDGEDGCKYHRLCVKLDYVLKDCILYIPKESKIQPTGECQYFRIRVTRTDKEKKYWARKEDHEVLDTSKVNPFIFYNEESKSWYCNDYSDCTERYFVNLYFGPGLRPTNPYWDTVTKTKQWTERAPNQRYANDPKFQGLEYR